MGPFLPFYAPPPRLKNSKKSEFWKNEKSGLSERIFCHFGPFFALLPPWKSPKLKFGKICKTTWRYPFTHVYHKWRSYNEWFFRYKAHQTEFYIILGHLLPFDPSNHPKNQHFEKLKKLTADIIILHLCNTNNNHIMFGSWGMECDRHNFLSFWTIFCSFASLTTPKINILKKWKKYLRDIILHMCTRNENHMMYGSWDKEHDRQNFFPIWTILCPFTPLTTQKIKIKKLKKQKQKKTKKNKNKQKTPGNIIILHKYAKYHDHMLCSWDIACGRCNYFSFWAIFCSFIIT